MARLLRLPRKEFPALCELLSSLAAEGHVVSTHMGRYTAAERTDLVLGRVELRKEHFAFVAPVSSEGESIYVEREGLETALQGDLVEVRTSQETPGAPPAGRRDPHLPSAPRGRGRRGRGESSRSGVVVRVVERARETYIGSFCRAGSQALIIPDGHSLPVDARVPAGRDAGASSGEKVLFRLLRHPRWGDRPEAEVLEVLGHPGSPAVDLRVVVEEFRIPVDYPEEALALAGGLAAAPLAAEVARREDLRELHVITIDPADARDFDDAVSLERLPDGKLRLGVHIADVAYYVKPDDAIDREARRRGTSVYLPSRAIHMLPERLSSQICSLRPQEDHLTISAMITCTADGHPLATRMAQTVIRSRRRFTYEEVSSILEGHAPDGQEIPPDAADHRETLTTMRALADAMRGRRLDRGALELEIPRPRLVLDDKGYMERISRDLRDASHGLIEEFMLAANEAVARILHQQQLPHIARIHMPPRPQDLEELLPLLLDRGLKARLPLDRHDLQRFLFQVRGTPGEFALNLLLLRTLQKARYSPNQEGHYALATDDYVHFTSPIRRYPDLVVHQVLTGFLEGEASESRRRWWAERVGDYALHSSKCEVRAESAERELVRLKIIEFLQDRIGDQFSAIVISVHEFGVFVQVEENLAEGLVHVRTLQDDYYRYEPRSRFLYGDRSGKTLRIGDRLQVRLVRADPTHREIDFEFVSLRRPPRRGQTAGGAR
ncbi:MAG: ribonuclease R [Planctomycetes bacterium]|nr:ribonuclease R [Planctomycetota bacterium]